jgi:glutaredoxin 2
MGIVYPDPFLEVRVQVLDLPKAIGLCAGYDGGAWRTSALANYLFQWLPYAALSKDHLQSFSSHNFVELLRTAAAHIYKTKKTKSRGEIGELMLHIACISHCGTVPVVCKLILKTSSNDTVKGFDGVHLLPVKGPFELWLGESKFYDGDGKSAVKDAVQSIKAHIIPSFLATEKAMLIGHIPDDIPFRDQLIKLFKQQTSGDDLLKIAVFPILITYDSASATSFNKIAADYVAALEKEIAELRKLFSTQVGSLALRFQLIFVPLKSKAELVAAFDHLLEPFK